MLHCAPQQQQQNTNYTHVQNTSLRLVESIYITNTMTGIITLSYYCATDGLHFNL